MPQTPVREVSATVVHEPVFGRWDYAYFIPLTALKLAALVCLLYSWFTLADWSEHPVLLGLMTLLLAYNVSTREFHWFLLLWMHRPQPIPARQGWRVGVATTFVPGAEPLTMLEETVRALVALDYPHDTWVLDEGDDAQVKALCLRLGANHFSRKHRAKYQTERGLFQARSKHGNYNAWLHEIGFGQYDIFTHFDPDHVPHPTFLGQVLGYFDDPRVGYVQAPQTYYNQEASFIARGAAEETYAYYSITQMASSALGLPIITGCHTTHRVAALEEMGGFAPHDADDLLITLWYRAAGWNGVYLPHILAEGLTPVDWAGYLIQQRRWARSVLDIKFRIYPTLMGRLPYRERLWSLLHGLCYVRGLSMGIVVGLLAYMLTSGQVPRFFVSVTLVQMAVLYAILQGTDLYKQRYFLAGRKERGLHWRAGLLQLAKWPYLLIALMEVLLARQHPYMVTLKVRSLAHRSLMFWAHLPTVALLVSAWIVGVVQGHVVPFALHLWTVGLVCGSLVLMWTERWTFPAPYDWDLWERHTCDR